MFLVKLTRGGTHGTGAAARQLACLRTGATAATTEGRTVVGRGLPDAPVAVMRLAVTRHSGTVSEATVLATRRGTKPRRDDIDAPPNPSAPSSARAASR
jgi:hypothetical protein